MMGTNLDELLRGTIDMHMHPGPDTFPFRVDALEAAKQAQQSGMKAIVLKNHFYPTVPLAIMVNQLVPGVKVFGSICLDYEIGGLNILALEYFAKLGAKVVWMPTFSAINSRAKMRSLGLPLEGEGYSILGTGGSLMPEIGRILNIIKKYDMVLATGHLSPKETFALINEARKTGVSKMVITHPLDREFVDQPLSLEELKQLAQMGAYIELTVLLLMPTEMGHSPAAIVEAIKTVGAEHCILSTDLGEANNPPPVEGMRMFISTLLRRGVKREEIELMAKVNPGKLLGLS
jgi:hypothetical protein